MGVSILRLPKNSGPASARNYGALHANGDILIFVDADVVVSPDAISRMAKALEEHSDVAAVFGSYDAYPRADGVVSQYRNLLHHFVHQNGNPEASTFWAGFGAIRHWVFEELGGFDVNRFPKCSIEDIALGYRLRQAGYRILLDKEIQVTHLKRWTLRSVIWTDIFYRAIPWSKLILDQGNLPSDLNLQLSHRVSSMLVFLLIIMLTLAFFDALNFFSITIKGVFIFISLLLIVSLLFLNRKLYSFFFQKRGIKFLLFAIPLHFLYYSYSGLTFAVCWILHKFSLFIIDLKKAKTLI
ncbi:MAG: glycosyltransferase, partial [Nitrososphaera sp.]